MKNPDNYKDLDYMNMPKRYLSLDHLPKIEGPNLESLDLQSFLESYLKIGFQGSNLGMGIEICKEMRKKAKIFIAMSGNMISSGNREIITYLVKNKMIAGIVTSAAGVEEDVLKCIKPFHLGSFDVKGEYLFEHLVGRIGNLYVPVNNYLYFERFINGVFSALYEEQQNGKLHAPHEITRKIGEMVKDHELTKENHEQSYLYWAAKNDIPVFCPGIIDGAFGDIVCFFKENNKDFVINAAGENPALTKLLMNTDCASSLILGGGISKHFLMNAAIFRNGFDYSVYVTTATTTDGSDSGGNQEEAITWAKIKPGAKRVRVTCDATIAFPILAAAAFRD